MEIDVKQEGLDDFSQSFDDYGDDDDDNYQAADDSYYTGDSFDPSAAFVKLTPLEDDPLASQYSVTPMKRKRGRPRKSDSPVGTPASSGKAKRGRPPKSAVVEYSQTPKGRGRPKSGTKTPKERKRKRQVETVQGKTCDSCGKLLKLNSLLSLHKRIKHNQRTYTHNLHRKLARGNISSHAIVQRDFESSRNVYGCSRCGEMFNMWTRWRKHYIQRHLNRHKCKDCKIGFSYPLDLQHHKHKKHKAKVVWKKR